MHEQPLPAADQRLLDTLFGTAHPNRSRIGCPSDEVLRELAQRVVPLDDPAYAHLAECSECFRQVRSYQTPRVIPQRSRRLVAAVAAGLALIGFGIWYGSAPTTRTKLWDNPSARTAVVTPTKLDLRVYRVTRADQPAPPLPPLALTREHLDVRVILPVGSEPGSYDLWILDDAQRPAAEANGTATIVQHATVLETRLDLRSLVPGTYRLAVRRQGESWHHYPAYVN